MFPVIAILVVEVLKISTASLVVLPHVDTPTQFGDQKGCFVPELERVLEYNKPYSPSDSCVQYTCKVSNETYLDTCGKVAVSEGCRIIKGQKALPYSKCCDTVVCGAANSVLHG